MTSAPPLAHHQRSPLARRPSDPPAARPPAGLATATEVVRDHLTRLGARFGPGSGPGTAAGARPSA
ncbi:hypothetical protein EQG64_14330 [Streptomyces sp. S6]|nr:hypothetical protein EQG64_14330 [Streptomyces sp. S6]